MKYRILTTLLLGTLLLGSCQKTLVNETHQFQNATWMRFSPEHFSFKVNNTDDCYHIYMTVTLDTAVYTANDLPLVVNMHSDDSTELRMYYSNIAMRDKKGKRAGTFNGSKQTITQRVREYVYFNTKGGQNIDVKQGTAKYELQGIESFGIKIEKANLELPK